MLPHAFSIMRSSLSVQAGSAPAFVFKSCRVRKESFMRFVFFLHVVSGSTQVWLSNRYTSRFNLSSGIQFQFLQASCGVQGSAWGLQAPAESTDRWESNLAWRAWTENGRRQDGEAAAAAGHRGPAGTKHLHDLNMSNSTPGSRTDVAW